MAEYAEIFEKLFVPSSDSRLSAAQLIDVLQFPSEMSDDDGTVENYLNSTYIRLILKCWKILSSLPLVPLVCPTLD